MYIRGDRRRNRSERSSRRSSGQQSPVGCSIKQVYTSPRRSPVVYTRGDCRGDCRGDDCRDNRRDSRLVYIHYRRSSPRRSLRQSRRRSPRVYAPYHNTISLGLHAYIDRLSGRDARRVFIRPIVYSAGLHVHCIRCKQVIVFAPPV